MSDMTFGSGAMFDAIAPGYDRLNRVMSVGLDQRWRRRLVETLPRLDPDDRVLDLACGTADVALAIAAARGCRVVGVDPSPRMLAVGQEKTHDDPRIELVEGDAQALAYPADHFAATTMAFGIRNVPDRDRALAEIARVTRPGGIVAILELGEPDGLVGRAGRFYVHQVVPRIGRLLSSAPEYAYLAESIAAFPPRATFVAQMRAAGLRGVTARPLTFGAVTLYAGHAP